MYAAFPSVLDRARLATSLLHGQFSKGDFRHYCQSCLFGGTEELISNFLSFTAAHERKITGKDHQGFRGIHTDSKFYFNK